MKKQRWHQDNPLNCPIVKTLSLITGKWKPMIIHQLMQGTLRHSELKKNLRKVTQKVLTEQLKQLEKDGLIIRTSIEGKILHVEYSLSELGESFVPVLEKMYQWGQKI